MPEPEELMAPRGEYRLEAVSLSVDSERVRFQARLMGPRGAKVWARAWISNESGTLAEIVAPKAVSGDVVIIDIVPPASTSGCIAVMRIESKPLETEHILMQKL